MFLFQLLKGDESAKPGIQSVQKPQQASPLNPFLTQAVTEQSVANQLSRKLAEKGVDLSIAKTLAFFDSSVDAQSLPVNGTWKNSDPLPAIAGCLFEFAKGHSKAELKAKIEEVSSALAEIQKAAGMEPDRDYQDSRLGVAESLKSSYFDAMPDKGRSQLEISGAAVSFGYLSDGYLAGMLIQSPQKFVELQKCGGGVEDNALFHLTILHEAYRSTNTIIREIFEKCDVSLVKQIGMLLQDDNVYLDALGLFAAPNFLEYHEQYFKLMELSSIKSAALVATSLSTVFEEDQGFFMDVAKSMGKNAEFAFKFLMQINDYVMGGLYQDPNADAEGYGDTQSRGYILENKEKLLSAFNTIAKAVGNHESKWGQRNPMDAAFCNLTLSATDIGGDLNDFSYGLSGRFSFGNADTDASRQAIFDAQRLIGAGKFTGEQAAFVCFAVRMGMVLKIEGDSGKISKIRDMLRVLDGFGIESYARYSPKVIESIYLAERDPGFSKGERNGFPIKNALIILNKSDDNGAFEHFSAFFESLIDKGYNLALCEADDEREVAARFFNNGLLQKKGALKKYDLLFLGGHGSPESIGFGSDGGEQDRVDLSDFSGRNYRAGQWSGMFKKNAKAILASCSTGAKGDAPSKGNPGNFQNMMGMVASITKIGVFAPTEPTNFSGMIFDAGGRVSNVSFGGLPGYGEEGSITNYKDGSKK